MMKGAQMALKLAMASKTNFLSKRILRLLFNMLKDRILVILMCLHNFKNLMIEDGIHQRLRRVSAQSS